MGWEATELERQGIRTEKGDINREIRATNERIAELKCEIVFEKGILENYSTLKDLDNVSNEQVKSNFTKRDLSEIWTLQATFTSQNHQHHRESGQRATHPRRFQTYEQWKTINNSIVELEQTGVLAEKEKLTQEKIKNKAS